MSGAPRIAVLIPCYRDGELAAQAVASIRESEPVEVVIIDDCSNDPTNDAALERLEAEEVIVVRHDANRGPAAARTSGLAATTAPYVFPLDADDLAVPGVLRRMADRLDRHPGAAVCFGDYVEFGDSELVRAVPTEIDAYRVAYTNEYPVSAMFRRTVLEAVDAWPSVRAYEDWHLWMTLAERGHHGVHLGPGEVTYRRRLHGHRLLAAAKYEHSELYGRLRQDHPDLFAELPAHRRRSQLRPLRRMLYPIVYGARTRRPWERRVKALLDRAGVWTLRR